MIDMARGKSISVYLMDGEASGRIKATISNWVGVAFKIPREKLSLCKERDEFTQSSVYFLFGEIMDEKKPAVYIGQAGIRKSGGGILARLIEHDKNPEKSYWSEAVVFTTSNNIFGSTELNYLEHHFCKKARDCGRFMVCNANDPTAGNITEEKESELEEFSEYAELVLGVLGYKVFENDTADRKRVLNQSNQNMNQEISDEYVNQKKIGKFVQQEVYELFKSGRVPYSEIRNLTSLEYCKSTFGKQVYYPMLVEWPEGIQRDRIAYLNGNWRYYAKIVIEHSGYRYLLSSQWYADSYPMLIEWYQRF